MSNPEQLMARIVDGQIVDCPVDVDFVNQRNNPTDDYIPVLSAELPVINTLIQKIETSYQYFVTHVLTVHKVLSRTIEELLVDVQATGTPDGNGGVTLNIANIPLPLVMAVAGAATDRTQQRLDQFASTRGYDDIGSACTYFNSTFLKFRTEGEYCIELRDSTWTALYTYLDGVQQGVTPVPQKWEDIEVVLPIPAWPA